MNEPSTSEQQPGLYLGTSGILLPFKNQKQYPAEYQGQSRLQVYGQIFNSLEVNSIFYKLPRPATVAQWSDAVPDSFRFTFKLWKQVTHNPAMQFDPADIAAFARVIRAADRNRGSILVQFPPSAKFGLFPQLAELLAVLREETEDRWEVAVEFRDKSWYRPETYDLLDDFRAAMVFHDKKGSHSPQDEPSAETVYLRFHGPNGDYRGSYDEGLLYEYAGYIQAWREAGKTVYVYFNNTAGDALGNLQSLREYVAGDPE